MPTGRAAVVVDALPPATVTGPPMLVEPTSNWTLPLAAVGVTVAESVTVTPDSCGLAGLVPREVVVVASGTTVNVAVPVELP